MAKSNDFTFGAVLGLGAGIAAFWYGFRMLSRIKLLQRTPTSRIRSLAVGQVEIMGQAIVEGAPLLSPFAQAECVYYSYCIEEYRKRGKRASWVTIKRGASSDAFGVQDATGRITVFPTGAELHLSVDRTFRTAAFSDSADEVVFKAGLERLGVAAKGLLFERRLRCQETYVQPGDKLFIFGTAVRKAQTRDSEVNAENLIISAQKQNYFVISDKSEKDLIQSSQLYSVLLIVGGPILTVVCLWYLLGRFGIV